jgi:hypothetical protein
MSANPHFVKAYIIQVSFFFKSFRVGLKVSPLHADKQSEKTFPS